MGKGKKNDKRKFTTRHSFNFVPSGRPKVCIVVNPHDPFVPLTPDPPHIASPKSPSHCPGKLTSDDKERHIDFEVSAGLAVKDSRRLSDLYGD